MPRLSFLPTILRETLAQNPFPREPEPDLVMDGDDQVAAYAVAGRIDGVMAASYLFNSAGISATIRGCRTVLDLGCGPATQLAQIADLNPDIEFHGVDLSPGMLDSAKAHVGTLGLANVRFSQGDITKLDFVDDRSVDAVISTMALHHLPTIGHLEQCFGEIQRVLKPGGAVYLVDFGRLKSRYSVLFFAYMNAKAQPHIFSLDYERSLRAAFEVEDFRQATKTYLPANAKLFTTFLVPILTLIRTPPRAADDSNLAKFKAMRRDLPRRYRADLDDMRLFFRLNGMASDPFR